MNDLIKIENNNGRQTVSGRNLHEFLEVETKYNDWIKRMIAYGFVENTDFVTITQKRVTAQGNETSYVDHQLTIDMAKEISMLQRTEKGKQARQYFIEVEKRYKEIFLPSYQIEDPIERASKWIVEQKEKQIALIERDKAIKEKAYISDKKTASAMNKASQLSKENAKLKEVIGEGKKYAAVAKVQVLVDVKLEWKLLKNYCEYNGLEIKKAKVDSRNYSEVNSYPAEAYKAVYNIDISKLF